MCCEIRAFIIDYITSAPLEDYWYNVKSRKEFDSGSMGWQQHSKSTLMQNLRQEENGSCQHHDLNIGVVNLYSSFSLKKIEKTTTVK